MTIDELIEDYLSVKSRIVSREKTVADLTPRQLAGLVLRLSRGDVALAIQNAQNIQEQPDIATAASEDAEQAVKWTKALEILRELVS